MEYGGQNCDLQKPSPTAWGIKRPSTSANAQPRIASMTTSRIRSKEVACSRAIRPRLVALGSDGGVKAGLQSVELRTWAGPAKVVDGSKERNFRPKRGKGRGRAWPCRAPRVAAGQGRCYCLPSLPRHEGLRGSFRDAESAREPTRLDLAPHPFSPGYPSAVSPTSAR